MKAAGYVRDWPSYSIDFILRLLEGDKFDDICNNPVSDAKIRKQREWLFT